MEKTTGGAGGMGFMAPQTKGWLALWLTSGMGREVASPSTRDCLVYAESSPTGCIVSAIQKSSGAISSSMFVPRQGHGPAPGAPSCPAAPSSSAVLADLCRPLPVPARQGNTPPSPRTEGSVSYTFQGRGVAANRALNGTRLVSRCTCQEGAGPALHLASSLGV